MKQADFDDQIQGLSSLTGRNEYIARFAGRYEAVLCEVQAAFYASRTLVELREGQRRLVRLRTIIGKQIAFLKQRRDEALIAEFSDPDTADTPGASA